MSKMISKALLCALLITIASFLAAGETMAADVCQDQCTVATKFGDIIIKILPDTNDRWPIVVNEPGAYRCDDPNNQSPDNYPCLAWPYQCFSGDCSLITKGSLLIPNCCDKPIEILWTSQGAPGNVIYYCDENPQSKFPNVCSGYELRLNNTSGGSPGLIFWFTTPEGIGTNMIDITIPIQSKNTTCLTGIKGPGCNTPLPDQRVEARTQCWEFIAEIDECEQAQKWYAEWAGTDACAVDVWACGSNNVGVTPDCDQIKDLAENPNNAFGCKKLDPEPLGTITDQNGDSLTAVLTNNSQCDEAWVRFVNQITGCNDRCYTSGGKKYCY